MCYKCHFGAHVATKLLYVQMFGNSEGMRDVGMDESGEQSIVVFALIITEPAIVSVCGAGSVTIYAKTTAHCSPDTSMDVE